MKKTYMQPAMQVMRIQQQNLLTGTTEGMSNQLQSGTVSSAWSRETGNWDDDE